MELLPDDALGWPAQPVAVEADRPVEVVYRESDEEDPRSHLPSLSRRTPVVVWPVMGVCLPPPTNVEEPLILLILAFMTALAWRSSFADAPTACGAIAEPLLRRRAASMAARQQAARIARECTSSAACDQPRRPIKRFARLQRREAL